MPILSDRGWAALRLGALILVAGALAIVPTGVLSALPSVCLFRNLLGVECLGCGMVRAASCALHGHIADAAAFNRLVIAAIPLAGAIAFRDFRIVLRSRKR